MRTYIHREGNLANLENIIHRGHGGRQGFDSGRIISQRNSQLPMRFIGVCMMQG